MSKTWVYDGDKVTFEGGPAPKPPKLRLWTTASDWEVIVRIHDDGREEVLYEHHNADSEQWQLVIKKVFGVEVEDVYLVDKPGWEWSRYDEIDPEIRAAYNANPKLSREALDFSHEHYHQALDPKAVALGLPLNLGHLHPYSDLEHDHKEIGYGKAFRAEMGEN